MPTRDIASRQRERLTVWFTEAAIAPWKVDFTRLVYSASPEPMRFRPSSQAMMLSLTLAG